MQFGFCVMANIDEIGFFRHVEALGYDSVWVADSQMLFSDCYAVLALAAQQTTKLRIGPGTAICGTRIPPVHVGGDGDAEQAGAGAGVPRHRHRQHRDAQHGPAADADRRIRRLICVCWPALLRGETVEFVLDGGMTRPIRMLLEGNGGGSLKPKIPLYVSGFGPRAMGLAGLHGDGLVFAIPPRGVPVAQALAHARQGASARQPRARRGAFPHLRADQCRAAATGRGGRFRSCQGGDRSERHGQRVLFLRRGAGTRHRPAALPCAHLARLLRFGRANAAAAPSPAHARISLHEAASRRGSADRCAD